MQLVRCQHCGSMVEEESIVLGTDDADRDRTLLVCLRCALDHGPDYEDSDDDPVLECRFDRIAD